MIQWPLRFVDPQNHPQNEEFWTLVGRQLLTYCEQDAGSGILPRQFRLGSAPSQTRRLGTPVGSDDKKLADKKRHTGVEGTWTLSYT